MRGRVLFDHGALGLWDWDANSGLYVPEWAVLERKDYLADGFLDWAEAHHQTWYAQEVQAQFVDKDTSMGCTVPEQKRMERNLHKEALEAWHPARLILMQSDRACESCPFSMLCLAHEPLGCSLHEKDIWIVHDHSPQYYPCGPNYFPFHCPRCHCFFFTLKVDMTNGGICAGVSIPGTNGRLDWPYSSTLYCCPHLRNGKWDRQPLRENGVPLFPGPRTAERHIMTALFGGHPNATLYEPAVACARVHRVGGRYPEIQWVSKPRFHPEHPSNIYPNAHERDVEVSFADCLTHAYSKLVPKQLGTLLPSDPWKYIDIEVR